jgi:hypothetical protein
MNLPYLQIEYAQFTSSFSKCNIGQLIEQPKGVQLNEWIATNCIIHSFYFLIRILFFAFIFKLFLFIIIFRFYGKFYLIYVQNQHVQQ